MAQSLAPYECQAGIFLAAPADNSIKHPEVYDWVAFVKSLDSESNYRNILDDTKQRNAILNEIKSKAESSSFHKTLLAISHYHGCLGVEKSRSISISLFEADALKRDPLALYYLSLEEINSTNDDWLVKAIKRVKKGPAYNYNQSILLSLEAKRLAIKMKELSKKSSDFMMPFWERNKYDKKLAVLDKKYCPMVLKAHSKWAQNSYAVRGLSYCKSRDELWQEAYAYMISAALLGSPVEEAQIDRMGIALTHTEYMRVAFKIAFSRIGLERPKNLSKGYWAHEKRVNQISDNNRANAQRRVRARQSISNLSFKGYPCTSDCSGHLSGFEWAARKGISVRADCGGKSQSFIEGCWAWVEGK